ncbi:MAG: hypothetical protein WAZ34_07260 [Rhodocyclaceae bacterium]
MELTTRADTPFSAAHDAAETMLNNARSRTEELTGAASENARKIKPTIERVAGMAHQTVDKVVDVVGPTADWLSEQSDSLKAGQRKVATEASQYVSAHPWKSLGLALAAGFVASRFVR